MAVLMLGLHSGPHVTSSITLCQFLGYCLLVIAAVLALRMLVAVLRLGTTRARSRRRAKWRATHYRTLLDGCGCQQTSGLSRRRSTPGTFG